jgi:hypothetical protein
MFSGKRVYFYQQNVSTGAAQTLLFVGPSAPICLEFGSDIQLLNEDYPGKQGTWNFQITVQANNTLPDASYTPQMDIVVMYMGSMTIANQSVTLNTGIMQPGTVPELTKVTFPHETDFYAGGNEQEGEHPVMRSVRKVARRYLPPPEEEEEGEGMSAFRRQLM